MIYLAVIPMTFAGAAGAFFFKISTEKSCGILCLLSDWHFYFGGCLYVLAALLNVLLLRYIDYTVLYPMTAVTYIWTLLLSRVFLKETIHFKKILGIFAICFGVFLLTR